MRKIVHSSKARQLCMGNESALDGRDEGHPERDRVYSWSRGAGRMSATGKSLLHMGLRVLDPYSGTAVLAKV